ncbi:hypothetical protein EV424DRAFT_1350850 [Suillus variegatus]|nr:hypothetical protein EV424DRAFT_1350850 [Suillus variegatus]
MVKHTCIPATLKFTKECSYDVRPGDVVSITCGPIFYTEGVVCGVDFIGAQLTLETDNKQLIIPIQFIIKTCNIDLDAFNKCSDVATKKSYMTAPPQSVTPLLERIAPFTLASSSAITWETWSPEVLAVMSSQNNNANPSTEDPWTLTPAIPSLNQPHQNHVLKEHASQFYDYHAFFNVSVGFQGGKLLKWPLPKLQEVLRWTTKSLLNVSLQLSPKRKIKNVLLWMVRTEEK